MSLTFVAKEISGWTPITILSSLNNSPLKATKNDSTCEWSLTFYLLEMLLSCRSLLPNPPVK